MTGLKKKISDTTIWELQIARFLKGFLIFLDMAKQRETVKCEGRFSELRQHLYENVFPLVLGERTLVTKKDLVDAWDLIKDDVYSFDTKDPYFESRIDNLRRKPALESLSLVPLVETPSYGLEKGLVRDYSLSQGNHSKVSGFLEKMNEKPLKFFREVLGREPKTVIFPKTQVNLSNYLISADIGVGTLIEGGFSGGGIRSDAPFILGINHLEGRTERNLAAVIGFWANDNTMVVSQIQSCGNAKLPNEVKFGEGCLYLAEIAARAIGFDKIATYSAREHPIFKEHPENWGQMSGDFVCMYDNSSKKLGYDGSRHGYHFKDLKNGTGSHPTITLKD